ncbi:MAG: DNA repair protein RecN [Kiritimatiellia bacterium]
MLTNLRIKNLAVVDDASVTFAGGLNVITGETGAGKSMLADALQLVLGERADKSIIRTGTDQSIAEAVFFLPQPEAIDALLQEAGLEPCMDGELVLRRTIATNGPSRVFVNETPASVQLLRKIGDYLVDMHGPHEHQSLLNAVFQRDILDAFGKHTTLLRAYQTPYHKLVELQAERESYNSPEGDTAAQIDLLDYQIRELQQADLENTDEEELLAEHSRIANAARIIELADGITTALTGEEQAALSAIVAARKALTELAELLPEAQEWLEMIETITIQTKDISHAVASMLNRLEIDPERLLWIEDRIALLQKLKRKYGRTIGEMRNYLASALERRQKLASREERLAAIAHAIEATNKDLTTHGESLRQARTKNATALAKQVEKHLWDLGFQHGRFAINILPAPAPGPEGLDIVDFGFAPNPGEDMRSLKAIASSGEISRVMLALKAVLAQHDRVPVLVFDEIDANLGGEMGNAVGKKLAAVAHSHQVLCITHLPQVAVCGAHHLVVRKMIKNGRTSVVINSVTDDKRAEEIARMLGGRDLTSVTLQHARELLQPVTS